MNYVEINTDAVEVPKVGESLIDNRNALAKTGREGMPKVTIIIQAYNRIEKLKRCVESVLTYTKNIEYELLLLDNGSSEEVLDYFKSVPFEKKRIVRITKNLRSSFPSTTLNLCDFGEFIVHLNDDLIVTKCWLDNLLADVREHPYANVIFTKDIYSSRKVVLDYMAEQGILCAGRFGSWDYLWVGQSLLSGFDAAEKVLRRMEIL